MVVAFKPYSITLHDVLHVAEFGANSLLSVYRLLLAGYEVKLELENTTLTCKKTCKLRAEGGHVNGGLFRFTTKAAISNFVGENIAMHLAGSGSDKLLLWHNRLGHMSFHAIKQLPAMVEGIQNLSLRHGTGTPDTCACEACIIGKMARKPFSSLSPTKRSTRTMELIHSDVVGPIQVRSHGGQRYAIAFTDDFSRWSEIHFMTEKSEVPEKFKLFKAKMSTYGKMARLRTDGGGEYASNQFKAYLQEEGITHEITAPYSPASNGVSERTNRDFLDPTHCILKHAGMPLTFWAEAMAVSIYVKNQIPHRALKNGKMSPFEELFKRKPDIGHLRVFGCLAYAHIAVETGRKKLDDRARKCVFLGYTETASIWRLYDPTSKRVFTSRDVKFVETSFPYRSTGDSASESSGPQLVPLTTGTGLDFEEEPRPAMIDDKNSTEPVNVPIMEPKPAEDASPQVPRTRKKRGDDLSIDMNWQPAGGDNIFRTRTRGRLPADAAASFAVEFQHMAFLASPGPCSYTEAVTGPDSAHWSAAITSEMESLREHEVFDNQSLQDLPKSTKVVDSKWILMIKITVEGAIDKYKARLVARGFSQDPDDYGEISSPVIDAAAVRYTLGFAAINDLEIAVLDVPTAYLGATLHEEVYIQLPHANWSSLGYTETRPIVRLKKSVPGLKQSGRCWFDDISGYLSGTLKMHQSISTPALFYSTELLLNLYVDDLLIVGQEAELRSIVNTFHEKFRIKGAICGDKFSYLGLCVTRDREQKQIRIDQRGYLQKVLEKFEMHTSKGRAMPLESKPVPRSKDEEAIDRNLYRQAVGCILYAALGSRPDFAYAVGVLGRFAGDPSIHHWKAIKHLLRYIKGTLHLSLPLVHKGVSATGLVAYADADHGGDPVASKSTSGYLVYADGILIHWKSKKQQVVAQSTMEAELIAIVETWKCMQWVRDMLSELGHWPSGHRTLLYNDNQSAVQVLSSGNFSTDCRHMRMRFHHLVDCINKHELAIEYVPTGEMWADGLTKGLGGVKHREFLNMMGLG